MAGMYEFIVGLTDNFSTPFSRIGQSLGGGITMAGNFSFRMNELNNSMAGFGAQFNSIIAPGIEFERNMKEVKAMTGVTGGELAKLGENAKKLAAEFGGTASTGLESYKVILSKLDPELAKNSQAMDTMGRNVAMLARTMQGDTMGATAALTTAMNSYGVSTKDPIEASRTMARMMDMITKGAKVGSAEVPEVTAAMSSLGATAATMGVGFAEAQAAIQVLDKYGMKQGAEGGIAFRNVLLQMGEGRFMPKAKLEAIIQAGVNLKKLGDTKLPIADRLQELSKITKDGELVGEFFGKENVVAGQAMLQNIGILRDYTKGIQNSSGETKIYSDTIGSSFAARMERVRAVFANAGIAVFEATKQYLPIIQTSGMLIFGFSQMYPVLAMVGSGITWLGTQFLTGSFAVLRYAGSLLYTATYAVGTMVGRLVSLSTWQAIYNGITNFSLSTLRMQSVLMLGLARTMLVQRVASISSALTMYGYTAAMYALSAASWIASGGLWAFLSPILAVGAGFAVLGLAAYAIYKNWDTLKGYLFAFGQYIWQFGVLLWKAGEFMFTYGNPLWWLYKGVEYVFSFFPGAGKGLIDFFGWVGKWLWKFGEFLLTYGNPLWWLYQGISKLFSLMFPTIWKDLTSFFEKLGKTFADWGKWLYDTVKWIWDSIKGFFQSIGKALGMVDNGLDKTTSKVADLGKNMPKGMEISIDTKGAKNLENKKIGVDIPKDTGDIFGANIAQGGGDMLGGDTKSKRGLDAVSGGGAKNITINIGKLNEKIEINTSQLLNELGSASEIEAKFIQLFMRVMNNLE